ncbi:MULTISPECIES: flagellar hook-associated protein FlgK [Comamonadaceae]|uniref:flagellar hook-associated protein FlgK n=1 Tax=Acidovorax sacchari TaxID=3230736 RepID=UPI0034A19CE2
MSLLNVGARALLANQVALQTTGHNIANVNTAGYSRQTLSLQTVQGQFTGGGYIGQGVDVQTILRNHNELLTRQAAAADSAQSADKTRAERLSQLQDVFSGGTSGLGAAITDMLNSFKDVVASPTDMTARTVTITRMDETAARMRSAAERVNEIQYTVKEQLTGDVNAINSLAKQMASVNEQIARVKGNGQTPNDLLDQRDQIIRQINQYVQTTQVAADDGTVGLFVAGSQPLVLGTTATPLDVQESSQFPGSGQLKVYFSPPGTKPIELDDSMLAGGELSGLLRFHNNDLAEGRNLLGRMAQAIGMTMNAQHKLGITLDGQAGKDLFSVPTSMPGYTSGTAAGNVSFSDATKFAASDYEVRFTTPPAGQVVRLSDGKATAFTDLANLAGQQIDGLNFNMTAAGAAGERVLFKPFSSTALNIQAKVLSPRDLAAASPVNASMGTTNNGSLQLSSVQAASNPYTLPPTPGGVTLTFDAGPPSTYGVTGSTSPASGTTGLAYTPGQPITIDGWQITLKGTPGTGDTVKVGNSLDPQYGDAYKRNAGNASAMDALADVKMFDDATMSDGYAGLMAQVGTRTQNAKYASDVSATISTNLERDRTAVSGVNLDEEAAKLIQYQQAYQASAKVLQIAQNIFDNLIQTMGR